MSLPTPTGNPLPFPPGHFLFNDPVNQAWIYGFKGWRNETVEETLDRMAAELSKYYPGFPPFDWRWPDIPEVWKK